MESQRRRTRPSTTIYHLTQSLLFFLFLGGKCKIFCPLQVNDLRKELDCRALSSKGLKSQLIARLTKQLKVEEQVEESKEPEKQESKVVEEEEPTRVEEDREVRSLPKPAQGARPDVCICEMPL